MQRISKTALALGLIVAAPVNAVSVTDYLSNIKRKTAEYLTDTVELWKGSWRDQKSIAALTPSSPWLVDEVTRHIPKKAENLRVLEVGAGTGIITREIAKRLEASSMLDVIEIDTKLAGALKKKFDGKKYSNVSVHSKAVQDWDPESDASYDIIISTIPWTLLPKEVVSKILAKYQSILKPGGHISYISLAGSMTLGRYFLSKNEREKFDDKLALLRAWQKDYFNYENKFVALNAPPCYVHHLTMKQTSLKKTSL